MYQNFPEKLRKLKQWVLWKKERRVDGKDTKVPYRVDGKRAASTRPEDWSTFDECLAVVEQYTGLGFVFHEGVVGIDLDHCINDEGVIEPWARNILEQFDSYTEFSPSGNGLHIIVEDDAVLKGRKMDHVECYTSGRFFTVTGNVFEGRDLLRKLEVTPWYNETFGVEKIGDDEAEELGETDLPSDDTILRVMFSSKNGVKMKALYQTGDWKKQRYSSQSNADLALVGALMFFCCNDRITVDRLFRESRLYRAKWDEKRGALTYGQMTMNEAVSREVMKWDGPKVEFIMSGGENPAPLLIVENIYRAMNGMEELRNRYRLNDFSHMVEVHRDGDEWSALQDMDILEAVRAIVTNFKCFAKVSKDIVTDAIKLVAHDNKVNPQLDYFRGLVWDGVPRLDTWLVEAFGVPNDELHRKIGSNWLKGLVKRVIEPGCIFDEVLVLEGRQGARKSTAMRVLGSPWHTECTLSTEDREFYMLLARNVIVEFSEGEIVGRTSAQKLKAVITKTEDTYRAPYERGMATYKRACVFAMTTNNRDYQKDDTGGRRWLPVVLRKDADIDWLKANRDQLFAEAMHRVWALKETTHEYPKSELEELQSEKTEEDVYDEPVRDWYDNLTRQIKDDGIRVIDVYQSVIMKDLEIKSPMDKRMEWRISSILRRVLKLEKAVRKVDGRSVRRWVKE